MVQLDLHTETDFHRVIMQLDLQQEELRDETKNDVPVTGPSWDLGKCSLVAAWQEGAASAGDEVGRFVWVESPARMKRKKETGRGYLPRDLCK